MLRPYGVIGGVTAADDAAAAARAGSWHIATPPIRVICYVSAYAFQRMLIANDTFVIIFLPDTLPACALERINATSRYGFEILNDRRERPGYRSRSGFCVIALILPALMNNNDTVEMIRHNDCCVEYDMRGMAWDSVPRLLNNVPGTTQSNYTIEDFAENLLAIPGANCYEV